MDWHFKVADLSPSSPDVLCNILHYIFVFKVAQPQRLVFRISDVRVDLRPFDRIALVDFDFFKPHLLIAILGSLEVLMVGLFSLSVSEVDITDLVQTNYYL